MITTVETKTIMTVDEYHADRTARQKAADEAMKTSSIPIPTQEELDLMRLGLMHPDEKAGDEHETAHPPRAPAAQPPRRPDPPRPAA